MIKHDLRSVRESICVALLSVWTASCAYQSDRTLTDEPSLPRSVGSFSYPDSYEAALVDWKTPADVISWMGNRFKYDMDRAIALSESRKGQSRLKILMPQEFYKSPKGVCIDLARFGVETLKKIAPELNPRYLMIEFEPTKLKGVILRRHWLGIYQKDRKYYFYADSKRPSLVRESDSVNEFIADYESFRGRKIVAFDAKFI